MAWTCCQLHDKEQNVNWAVAILPPTSMNSFTMEDPKELLRQKKAILVVEFIEIAGAPCIPRLAVFPMELITKINPMMRCHFLSSLKAWLMIVKARLIDDPDASFTAEPEQNIYFPPVEELVQHAERALELLEKRWPYEAAFVRECVGDQEAAEAIALPYCVPGGLDAVKSLLPSNAPGLIFRVGSPVSYFQHQPPAAPSPNFVAIQMGEAIPGRTITELLRGVFGRSAPASEPPEPPEFKFPDPES